MKKISTPFKIIGSMFLASAYILASGLTYSLKPNSVIDLETGTQSFDYRAENIASGIGEIFFAWTKEQQTFVTFGRTTVAFDGIYEPSELPGINGRVVAGDHENASKMLSEDFWKKYESVQRSHDRRKEAEEDFRYLQVHKLFYGEF